MNKYNVIHGDLKPRNILLNWLELVDSDAKYCLVKLLILVVLNASLESFRCPAENL